MPWAHGLIWECTVQPLSLPKGGNHGNQATVYHQTPGTLINQGDIHKYVLRGVVGGSKTSAVLKDA